MKKLVLFVALLVPALAHAQMPPNHELPQFKNLKAAPVAQPKSMLRMRAMAPVAATAASSTASGSNYAPFLPQGGISHQTDVPEVYADGTGGTLAQIGQMADGSVQQTTINAANGVAGLDENGNASAPVVTGPALNGAPIQSVQIGTDPQKISKVTGQPWLFGGNSTAIFGAYPQPNLPRSPMGYWSGFPVNLVVAGSPSGPYNAGCSLCVFTDAGFQNTTVAELSGEDYTKGKVSPGFDVAALFMSAGTENARLALPVSSYTANTVVLSSALTPAQLLHVKQGMFISTNSLVPGMSSGTIGDANLPVKDYYAGVVKRVSSDSKTITVYGWAALGKTATASDIPSTTSLETYYWKNYTSPYVFIGAPTKMFGRNTVMTFDGNRVGDNGLPSTSSIRQFEGEELDFNTANTKGTAAKSVSYHGLTFGGNNADPRVLTDESYAILLAGSLPNYLKISDSCGSIAIQSGGYYLPSACIVGAAHSNQAELFEYKGYANSNKMNFGAWLNRESGGANGWTNVSVNLGVNIDGTYGKIGGSGAKLPYLSWNNPQGALSIRSPIGEDVLTITASGGMIITWGTPSSSTAPCKPGQKQMDADYTYSCVAPDTWRRASNGTTW